MSVMPMLWSGCSHTEKDKAVVSYREGGEQVLVDAGQNSQAVYSPSGDRLIFVSAERPGHKQPQVYEKYLSTGAERRITFQNGSTFTPRYHPTDNQIVYSSSTDELKEDPPLLNPRPPDPKVPAYYQEPVEIYLHNLSALLIVRITKHPGFDGEARFSNNGRELVWTQMHGQKSAVYALNLPQWDPTTPNSPSARTIPNLGLNPTQYMIAPNSQIVAWINWDTNYRETTLKVRRSSQPQVIEINAKQKALKTDVAFSSDSKWLLWAQKGAKAETFELWAMNTDTLCPQRLAISGKGERRHPTLSPDGKWLTYTLIENGNSHISRREFEPRVISSCP